ncbi:hypothetical protein SAMN06265222_108107 [Neorhodopirellula lusitana]|uniref:Secreted protein n=1 Tax=Neorhodopirellula lusitana TaxID=445327 RepID=A0ABY1QB99_9BACT|nr:hypothetical protein [Neorhodopirellula lusitana]SMP63567.1 hypothetical protein SAMN06265222_108107 [Neorhodopirellula lusitana]
MNRFIFLIAASISLASLAGCDNGGGNVVDGASEEEIQNYRDLYQKEKDAQAEMQKLATESGAGA